VTHGQEAFKIGELLKDYEAEDNFRHVPDMEIPGSPLEVELNAYIMLGRTARASVLLGSAQKASNRALPTFRARALQYRRHRQTQCLLVDIRLKRDSVRPQTQGLLLVLNPSARYLHIRRQIALNKHCYST